MKTRLEVRNGNLTGMTQEEVKADVLSHMIVYVEAKNSFDNNKDHPLNGQEYQTNMY